MDYKDRMQRLVQNESPEVVALLMANMAEHIENQKSEITRLQAEQAKREQQSFNIEEKLKLIRRSIYGRKDEKRVDASDRPRTKSQSENLLFSQAMFPTNEVRDESGKTIKTRWSELDSQEIEVAIQDGEFEEEGRLRGIQKHSLEKWSDFAYPFCETILSSLKVSSVMDFKRIIISFRLRLWLSRNAPI